MHVIAATPFGSHGLTTPTRDERIADGGWSYTLRVVVLILARGRAMGLARSRRWSIGMTVAAAVAGAYCRSRGWLR